MTLGATSFCCQFERCVNPHWVTISALFARHYQLPALKVFDTLIVVPPLEILAKLERHQLVNAYGIRAETRPLLMVMRTQVLVPAIVMRATPHFSCALEKSPKSVAFTTRIADVRTRAAHCEEQRRLNGWCHRVFVR